MKPTKLDLLKRDILLDLWPETRSNWTDAWFMVDR